MGETKALKAEKLLATVEKTEPYYDDFVRLSKELEGKSADEAVKILSKEKGAGTLRVSWNGYSNIFKATADEIAEAATKIKEYRIANNLKGGNYGYLEGTVNGKTVDNKFWRSVPKDVAENEIHIFKAIEVEGATGNTWLRTTDSEYRMLNKLANDLVGGKAGNTYPNIKGELKIISENPYCASCTGIIQQFNEMFPDIKLILVDGIK